MKAKFNERTLKIELKLEEKDFYDAIQVQEMILGHFQCRKCGSGYESKGWEIMKGYFNAAREMIIEAGKDGVNSKIKRQLSDMKFAELKGFDYAMRLPERVVMQADLAKEAIQKQEEIKDAADE